MGEASWRYAGWRVVVACFFAAVCAWGFGFYGHAVFLAELQKRHGWSSGLISTATTAYYLLGAVLVAFVGDAVAWMGPKRFVLLGGLALGLSSAIIPFIVAPWQLYAAYLLMAFGWAATSLAAIVTVLGLWFHARRGMAISLALNGASTGSIIVTPAMVALTAWLGFTWAVPLTVLGMAAILTPMVLAWVDWPPGGPPPARTAAPTASGWTRARAMRSPAFWSVALPFALGIAAQVGFIVHQLAILEPAIGSVEASLAVALTGAFAIGARLALSLFVDRLDQRKVTAILLVNQATALFAITQTDDPLALYAACAAFGVTVGNLITLPALIIQREFPAAAFATIANLSTAVAGVHLRLRSGPPRHPARRHGRLRRASLCVHRHRTGRRGHRPGPAAVHPDLSFISVRGGRCSRPARRRWLARRAQGTRGRSVGIGVSWLVTVPGLVAPGAHAGLLAPATSRDGEDGGSQVWTELIHGPRLLGQEGVGFLEGRTPRAQQQRESVAQELLILAGQDHQLEELQLVCLECGLNLRGQHSLGGLHAEAVPPHAQGRALSVQVRQQRRGCSHRFAPSAQTGKARTRRAPRRVEHNERHLAAPRGRRR
jgi:MFS family permease